ncbi:hypothetical protein G7054_g6068 [Neopestalotiopsis clavispora]|nr:hypothetical protein G7054_g6068 [Neopestalotiopsis clavispora]
MADPLSIAGLAFGVASLTFELFSGCIKGFKLVLEASNMPEAYRFLLMQLQLERDKLVGWAILAKVSEDEESLASTLRISRHTINDALRELQLLLLDTAKLKHRYGLDLVASDASHDGFEGSSIQGLPPIHAKLEAKARRFFDATRKGPRRLKWATFDRSGFEELLASVIKLNESMMPFLDAHDRQKHFKLQEITYMEVLRVNNRMDDLVQLINSFQSRTHENPSKDQLKTVKQHDTVTDTRHNKFDERASCLARFKFINLAAEKEELIEESLRLQLTDLHIIKTAINLRTRAKDIRSCGSFQGDSIWIEWRYYQPDFEEDEEDEDEDDDDDNQARDSYAPPPLIETRISRMAKALHDADQPVLFRVPGCLGYVNDPEHARLGFVFPLEEGARPNIPSSLLHYLSNHRKISLTNRMKIARLISSSIWYLHSTEWVHKGLRSDNIVFYSDKHLYTSQPLLCGFDYSRPVDTDATTELPYMNPWHDLYRHPKAQFDVPREGKNGFRKLYDIYSLGVVLYEIGVWQPLHKVLGLEQGQRLRAATIKSVQSELLLPERLEALEAEAGALFTSVVKTCIAGNLNTQGPGTNDAGLQFEVWENIIQQLENIAI